MRGVNKVIIFGVLGKDPETKTFQNGGSICNFSIATSESWKDKNTGEFQEGSYTKTARPVTEAERVMLYELVETTARNILLDMRASRSANLVMEPQP
jgi:hypothetical protein